MLIIDDLLLGPFSGLLWIFEKVREAAQEELDGEADAITEELRQLYLALEAGTITEGEFDAQERRLLDRLDTVQARTADDEGDDDEDDDGEDDGTDDHEADDAVFGTYEDEEEDDAE